MFDILENAPVQCPRCLDRTPKEVQLFFGRRQGHTYRMGSHVWRADHERGPESGRYEGKGSASCPKCQLAFLVSVHIVSDIFVAVEPHKENKNYLED